MKLTFEWSVGGKRVSEASPVLESVLGTLISPELVPGDGSAPAQDTEAVVGPYELQDFHLYYTLRFGYRPSKIAFMAWTAWHDRSTGQQRRGQIRPE